VPNPTTSENAERQKVLPPPASDCHSVPEWRSSPSRIRHNQRFRRDNTGNGKNATQKATHFPIRRRTHDVAWGVRAVFGKGPRQANPHTRRPLSNQATAGRASETAVMYT
jgi:hypothetical protein